MTTPGLAMSELASAAPMLLASLRVGPLQFDSPVWLVLIPVLGALTILISFSRSISGLGSVTRWVALGARLLVILLLVSAMAEPQLRREAKDVATTVVLDASESVPQAAQQSVEEYVRRAVQDAKRPNDRLGLVTAAKDAYVSALPTRLNTQLVRQHTGALDGTDLSQAVRLALALNPDGAAMRLLLASDGNETTGGLLLAAENARAMGVPIDVLPIEFRYDREVMVDKVVAPATAREGENIKVRVVLTSIGPARGRLVLMMDGTAIDLDPDSNQTGLAVDLVPGPNVYEVPITSVRAGPQKFEAAFVAETRDALEQNNVSSTVTFVAGEARILVIASEQAEAEAFMRAMGEAKINADIRTPENAPATLTELNRYDAVVLLNQESYGFTQQQQEELRQYVHDSGGGLIMVGGPQSFGAGGWIGSPLEDALPVRLDPPQKRQMPRGALALIMHSVEMPEGTFYGKKVAESAVNALSRLDVAGIIEFRGFGDTEWVHKLAPVGDGTAIKRSIQGLQFGDMPDFTPSMELAVEGLSKVEAGQRHVIMISDGDPSPPSSALLDQYVKNRITISTVGVFPHSGADTSRLDYISRYTGGRHYEVNTQQALASLPQIFIKEAQTVRRSLISEGDVTPRVQGLASEPMRGISGAPVLRGYVVTAEREGLALVTIRGGQENDPICAQWQYGLGRSVAFTSDAATRWGTNWVGWGQFRQFWEQHVRWVMRPAGSANVRITTENKGDETILMIDALDSQGERLNFAQFRGRLAGPGGAGADIEVKQVGPGRYQAVVPSDQAGSYVASLRFAAPDPNVQGGFIEGSVQAAISRPFADEYRTLESNASLLIRVAQMTGGRVLNPGAAPVDLWSRTVTIDGVEQPLKMPVALTPIWFAVALAGLVVFLCDVGVRRVRIDIPAMWGAVRAAFGKSTVSAGQQLGGLQAARAQARQRLEERGAASEARAVAERAAQYTPPAEVSKAKFEASPEALKVPRREVALGGADARPEERRPGMQPDKNKKDADGGGPAAMSRLMEAKRKAREGMGEQDKPKQGGL